MTQPGPSPASAAAAACAVVPGGRSPLTRRADSDVLRAAVRPGGASAVYAADLARVARQLRDFRAALPGVTPYYAVKCNPDPVLLRFMARLGMNFDCASGHEIALVAAALGGGPVASRAVFANPFKAPADLAEARRQDIRLMTFDSTDELEKLARQFSGAQLLLRIVVEDSHATCPLSSKFGAQLGEVDGILECVRRLRLNLVGVAFHVGSGCTSVESYAQALKDAHWTFGRARALGLPELSVLDIGGGFPGYDGEAPITFRDIADVVRLGIARLFSKSVSVIAEPGRYFATAAYSLAVEVVLAAEEKEAHKYYLADGVFGSFRDAWLLNIHYPCEVLYCGSRDAKTPELSNLYGPTREAVDVVARNVVLPRLRPGDWLRFPNMGAYTMSLNTKRSGVDPYRTIYYFRIEDADSEFGEYVGTETGAFGTEIAVGV